MRNTSGATENTTDGLIKAVRCAVSPLARGLIGAGWPALTFLNFPPLAFIRAFAFFVLLWYTVTFAFFVLLWYNLVIKR